MAHNDKNETDLDKLSYMQSHDGWDQREQRNQK